MNYDKVLKLVKLTNQSPMKVNIGINILPHLQEVEMMNFNSLGDIIKQIRQFYYLRLNLHTQHAVTGYVIISIIVLPLTLVMLILHLLSLRKSSRLGTF